MEKIIHRVCSHTLRPRQTLEEKELPLSWQMTEGTHIYPALHLSTIGIEDRLAAETQKPCCLQLGVNRPIIFKTADNSKQFLTRCASDFIPLLILLTKSKVKKYHEQYTVLNSLHNDQLCVSYH